MIFERLVKTTKLLVLLAGLAVFYRPGRTISAQQPTFTPNPGRTLLRAGAVLDVRSGRELRDETVVIQGDRIAELGATASLPARAGDREVDLRTYTLMPGLIDVHTHLTGVPDFDPYF